MTAPAIDLTACPGDLVRVTTDGRGGYRPTEYVGRLLDWPALVYCPRVEESGPWGACAHANTWSTLEVLERRPR